jgi:hypothetical protein
MLPPRLVRHGKIMLPPRLVRHGKIMFPRPRLRGRGQGEGGPFPPMPQQSPREQRGSEAERSWTLTVHPEPFSQVRKGRRVNTPTAEAKLRGPL